MDCLYNRRTEALSNLPGPSGIESDNPDLNANADVIRYLIVHADVIRDLNVNADVIRDLIAYLLIKRGGHGR